MNESPQIVETPILNRISPSQLSRLPHIIDLCVPYGVGAEALNGHGVAAKGVALEAMPRNYSNELAKLENIYFILLLGYSSGYFEYLLINNYYHNCLMCEKP